MKKTNPKEWICKKCGLNMDWEDKDGKVVSPNYCDNCRRPCGTETHYYKKLK